MVGSGFGKQTITVYFGFFFFKERECFVKFYPLHKSQEKKNVISGGCIVSEQEGSKGGSAQKWEPKPFFFFNFAPIRNM
jgi:hypothetical protein